MSEQLEKVKMGYAHLTVDERKELLEFAKSMYAVGYTEDKRITEELEKETKFYLGPYAYSSKVCGCCGKPL